MALLTPMDQHALDELADEFGLKVLSSRHIKGGAKNTSYLIAPTDGHFVATVLEQQGPAFAEAYGSFLQQTIEHGFPTAPPRRTLQGKWFHLHNEKPVLMTSFIPGFYDRPLNEAEIFQLGILLARIHDSDLKRDVPPTVRLDETDLCWLEESSSDPFASWALVRHQQTADAVQADGLHRPTTVIPSATTLSLLGIKILCCLIGRRRPLTCPRLTSQWQVSRTAVRRLST